MNERLARRGPLLLALLGAAVTSWSIWYLKVTSWSAGLAFLAWACLPYAGIALWARQPARNRAESWVRLCGFAVVSVGGATLLIQASFHPDAQGGLIFLFLPIYQWIALATTWGIQAVIRAWRKQTD